MKNNTIPKDTAHSLPEINGVFLYERESSRELIGIPFDKIKKFIAVGDTGKRGSKVYLLNIYINDEIITISNEWEICRFFGEYAAYTAK